MFFDRRAEFDLYRTSCEPSARPMPQVFASCNFCGKSIAYNMLASRNRSYIISGTTSHRPKVGEVYYSFNCLLSLNFCRHFIIYFHISKIWTGYKGKIWIPTTVQILPAAAVQMLPSPQKFVNCPILRHEDLCHKADINKMHKTPSLIIAMFKTKPKTND